MFRLISIVTLALIATSAQADDAAGVAERKILDVDGDGEVAALTDGLMIIRSMFGFDGESLVAGTHADAVQVEEYMASIDAPLPSGETVVETVEVEVEVIKEVEVIREVEVIKEVTVEVPVEVEVIKEVIVEVPVEVEVIKVVEDTSRIEALELDLSYALYDLANAEQLASDRLDIIADRDAQIVKLLAQNESLTASLAEALDQEEETPVVEPVDVVEGIVVLDDSRIISNNPGVGFEISMWDAQDFISGHGYRIVETGKRIWDFAVEQIIKHVELQIDGIGVNGNGSHAVMALDADDALTVYASASTANARYTQDRLNFDDFATNSWSLFQGAPVHRGSLKAAEFLSTKNQLNIIAVQNNTVNQGGSAQYCDNDMQLKEDTIPLCGNFVHAAMVSGYAMDRTILVASVRMGNGELRADGAIKTSNENALFVQVPGDRTNSSSHGAGAMAAMTAMIIDNLGYEPTATELRSLIFNNIAQTQTIKVFKGLNENNQTIEFDESALVLSEAMIRDYFGI